MDDPTTQQPASSPENKNPASGILLIIGILILTFIFAGGIYFLDKKNIKQSSPKQIATPTPLPPFYIKKVDIASKSGEFVINNPVPQVVPSSEKQILINGTYQVDTKKITMQASVQNSGILVHSIPQELIDNSAIPLKIQMTTNNRVIYETDMPLTNSQNVNIIPFKTRLPFYSPVTIRMYSASQEIYSQDLKL